MAVTLLAAVMVTVQGAVPVQPLPNQPAKTEEASAAAVSITVVLLAVV